MGLKRKLIKAVDRKMLALAEEIERGDEYDLDETDRMLDQLDKLEQVSVLLKKPKMDKEVWIEILKLLGVLAVMGIAIAYDAGGHVLPKSLDKWIPGPKL